MRHALLCVVALALVACGGPKPEVDGVEASDVKDRTTIVSVSIRNTGGAGQVRLSVTVRDHATGGVVGREQRSIEMREKESLRVALEVHLPSGVERVSAEARATYPPD